MTTDWTGTEDYWNEVKKGLDDDMHSSTYHRDDISDFHPIVPCEECRTNEYVFCSVCHHEIIEPHVFNNADNAWGECKENGCMNRLEHSIHSVMTDGNGKII